MIDPNSNAYPFLAVAQQHGVDYGDVLDYADFIRYIETGHNENRRGISRFMGHHYPENMSVPVMAEIRNRVLYAEDVRDGKIPAFQ